MKIRVTVHFFSHYNNGNLVFAHAWKRFLDRSSSELERFEFVLINNDAESQAFAEAVAPYTIYDLPKRKPPLFDTESNYLGFKSGSTSGDADYLLRLDHEAFPSVEAFNAIANFLEWHPDVTFASASNFPRSIFHHLGDDIPSLDCSSAGESNKAAFPWHPWGLPTNNGDLFILQRDFFNECDEAFRSMAEIQNRRLGPESPFHSQVLTYRTICRLLDKTPRDDIPEIPVAIDGGLRSDFWTVMCRSPRMKMAGIVDHDGRSFCRKNHVVTQHNGAAAEFQSYKEVRDPIDVSWKGHELNIRAPYWHLGNGYLVEWYFDPRADHFKPNWDHFKPHFTAERYGNYVAHYALVRKLAELSPDPKLSESIASLFIPVLKEWGVDTVNLEDYCEGVVNFYSNAIADYL